MMKLNTVAALAAMALAFSFSMVSTDASAAKRFGGGKSSGMQRQSVTPDKAPTAAPVTAPTSAPTAAGAASAAKAPAAAPAAQPKRSWMGPLAGLAAGLGLAALASHFGFGGELASMMMMGLAVMAVIMLIGFIMRRRGAAALPSPAAASGLAYAASGYAGAKPNAVERSLPAGSAGAASGSVAASPAPQASTVGHIPADFDVAGFVRSAKLNFIRLQAANDAGNLDDIREFTSPEMFAEISLSMAERGAAKQETDVVSINATVLDVAEEPTRHIVSVRYVGLVREDVDASPQPIDEIWHLSKAKDGSRGWVVAGIQQVAQAA